jgi:hypothetical protein
MNRILNCITSVPIMLLFSYYLNSLLLLAVINIISAVNLK